jgi:hypothetical protein
MCVCFVLYGLFCKANVTDVPIDRFCPCFMYTVLRDMKTPLRNGVSQSGAAEMSCLKRGSA